MLCYWRADSVLTGEAEQIRKSVNFIICAVSAPCFAYKSRANAEPIILAANYMLRQYDCRYVACTAASPSFLELAH